MKNKFSDLIDQTYYFPQDGFDLRNGYLYFHGVSIKHLIEEHGTPFKLMYLPKIGDQIKRAKNWFKKAMKKHSYKGNYHYCYCTKCCHFQHVVSEALAHGIHLETSSSFDIDLILKLHEQGKVKKSTILVHNGYKTEDYLQKIVLLNRMGFKNSIAVLDNMRELERLNKLTRRSI